MQINTRWKRLLALDLGLFNVALFAFAYIPPETLIVPEILVMAGSVFCLIGVISNAFPKVHLPYEEWAYFITGLLGTLTLLLYVHFSSHAGDILYRIPIDLFLLSGIASAYAAHVITYSGGKDRV
jgi:hypothetical protein